MHSTLGVRRTRRVGRRGSQFTCDCLSARSSWLVPWTRRRCTRPGSTRPPRSTTRPTASAGCRRSPSSATRDGALRSQLCPSPRMENLISCQYASENLSPYSSANIKSGLSTPQKNMRFCRSLGVLNESTNTARHALYLINADGDLVFRQKEYFRLVWPQTYFDANFGSLKFFCSRRQFCLIQSHFGKKKVLRTEELGQNRTLRTGTRTTTTRRSAWISGQCWRFLRTRRARRLRPTRKR